MSINPTCAHPGKTSVEVINQESSKTDEWIKFEKKKVWKEAQNTDLQSKTSSHTPTLPLQTTYSPLYYHLDPPPPMENELSFPRMPPLSQCWKVRWKEPTTKEALHRTSSGVVTFSYENHCYLFFSFDGENTWMLKTEVSLLSCFMLTFLSKESPWDPSRNSRGHLQWMSSFTNFLNKAYKIVSFGWTVQHQSNVHPCVPNPQISLSPKMPGLNIK